MLAAQGLSKHIFKGKVQDICSTTAFAKSYEQRERHTIYAKV